MKNIANFELATIMKPNFSLTMPKAAVPVLAALILAGCAAPELRAPHIDIPAAYKQSATALDNSEAARWKPAQPAEHQARGEWWKVFGDPALDQMIDEATAANANLAVAAARVKQARALAGIAESDRVPAIAVQSGVQRSRPAPVAVGMPEGTAIPGATAWQARLSASYEVDLFGRVSGNVNASRATAAASEATFRSVLLALQADVAQSYFRLRALDAEIAYVADTVTARQESVRINQRRHEAGDLGELELARAKTELATTQAEAVALQRQRAQLEHALAVLLGKPASAYSSPTSPLTASFAQPAIPAGIPSALLERRPDIAAAQQIMMAANARIGAAKAAMFPALRLTAAGGAESSELADLFKWSSRSWIVGALLSLPILDGGRGRNAVAHSEAALEESVAAYRHSVLNAFAEVEDQLVSLRTLGNQLAYLEQAVTAAKRSNELANKLYQAGRNSYLDVLDAQRNLAAVERSTAQLRGARAVATVALIRSLGGDWQVR